MWRKRGAVETSIDGRFLRWFYATVWKHWCNNICKLFEWTCRRSSVVGCIFRLQLWIQCAIFRLSNSIVFSRSAPQSKKRKIVLSHAVNVYWFQCQDCFPTRFKWVIYENTANDTEDLESFDAIEQLKTMNLFIDSEITFINRSIRSASHDEDKKFVVIILFILFFPTSIHFLVPTADRTQKADFFFYFYFYHFVYLWNFFLGFSLFCRCNDGFDVLLAAIYQCTPCMMCTIMLLRTEVSSTWFSIVILFCHKTMGLISPIHSENINQNITIEAGWQMWRYVWELL